MPQLVQEDPHPTVVVLDIAQDADVTLTVNIDAVSVLILARALFQVASLENICDGQIDSFIERAGDGEKIPALELGTEPEVVAERRFLKERIRVVPGSEFVG